LIRELTPPRLPDANFSQYAQFSPQLLREFVMRRRIETKGNPRGVVLIESLWVMMIMLFASIAFVVWAILVMAAQGIDSAAAEAARVAARAGMSSTAERQTAAKAAADAILAAHGMESGDIQVSLDDGDVIYVTATVEVPLEAAGVPDWLSFMGFTFGTRAFRVSALARRE
jgi:hypothetical protein